MIARRLVPFALGILLPGCYVWHGHGDAVPTPVDSGVPSTTPLDAGPRRDSGADLDAGPLLPPAPDPDLGEDARPSDYPGAGEWDEPPDLAEDEPCCELGDPIRLGGRDDGLVLEHEPPQIEWAVDRWGSSRSVRWPPTPSRSPIFARSCSSSRATAPRSARRACSIITPTP